MTWAGGNCFGVANAPSTMLRMVPRPRFTGADAYVLGLFTLIAFRRALFLLVSCWTREGRLDRRTVVVGADGNGESLIHSLAAQRDSDVRVIGVFDDRGDDRSLASCGGVPKLGTVDDLVEFARHTRVDLVIFSLPISAESRILQMLKKLWVLPVDIRLSAHTNKLHYRPRSLIVDTDHWRHFFLLLGLIWGLTAATINFRWRTIWETDFAESAAMVPSTL
jgi:FlaA1/EpsC-like NDP-sugar epimerase